MPYEDPDPTDPLTLHGVSVETDNADAHREMAECFIEEFLRMGFDRERLLKLFQTSGYAGPFMAYQELGEAEILKMLDEQIRLRGPRTARSSSTHITENEISLPILET
ncbi:MAG: hypothetical protein ACE5EQ_09860 [Phycisphaerae bacterium]